VPLRSNPRLLDELAALVLGHVSEAGSIVRSESPAPGA
jgi:hypothetical protein